MTNTGDRTQQFEVVICPDDGYDEEHADLLRKRLVNDGFHDHVVSIRETDVGEDDNAE